MALTAIYKYPDNGYKRPDELTVGEEYNVREIHMGQSYTNIWIEGHPFSFNSVNCVFNFNEIDIERAADHFAANILLPTKNVLNKYYHLKQSGKSESEILFIIADLSASPYEAVLKRFVELDINTKQIDEQLNTITMRNEDPYITLIEHKLQQLRCLIFLFATN